MFSTINYEKQYTKCIYELILEERYSDAIPIIENIIDHKSSNISLSLLGYCYYNTQEYTDAVKCYKELSVKNPNNQNYKLSYAKALYQSGLFQEAFIISSEITATNLSEQVLQLQCAIHYSLEDYAGAQKVLLTRSYSQASTLNDEGCLLYQAGNFRQALHTYMQACEMSGFNALIVYNAALCRYRLHENTESLSLIAEIVELGIHNHPELGIGLQLEAENKYKNRSNLSHIILSGLAQALNLKAAIEYGENKVTTAKEALLDLPPRLQSELDPITLHNLAIINFSTKNTLRTLIFLLDLDTTSCPAETMTNVLLICCKYEMYDTAADILAEYAHLTYIYLETDMFDYLDAIITAEASKEEAEKKLSKLASRLTKRLRVASTKVHENRLKNDEINLREALQDYEAQLENYIPVAMAKAWLSYRIDDFNSAEKEFRISSEFCAESNLWKLHAAHILFMSGNKYKESVAFYEPIVQQSYDNILSVSPVVVANLCVSYIMVSKNEEAEELMRKVERSEDSNASQIQCSHSCIINLVIGTLYCAKGNFEFGLSRIIQSLGDNGYIKLCGDTWLHVKRCILGLLSAITMQRISITSAVIQDVMKLLRRCEDSTASTDMLYSSEPNEQRNEAIIALEARKLQMLFLKITENSFKCI